MMKVEKIMKYGKKAIYTVLIGSTMYLPVLAVTQAISVHNSPRINSQSHLEQILGREKNRAGIDNNTQVNARISDDEDEISHARKLSDGEYEIVLSPFGSNLSALRHELYHVADGHCDKFGKGNSGLNNTLTYLFWNEPQATIYQATGLKP